MGKRSFDSTRFHEHAQFEAWLGSLSPGREFNFYSSSSCLFASWAKECGMEVPYCGHITLSDLKKNTSYSYNRWARALSSALCSKLSTVFTAHQASKLLKGI